jgi:hypothetical protein
MQMDVSVFGGFPQANTTPVPDFLFDELLTKLSWDELKVMLYIIRRTAGFRKPTDAISLTQFTKGITTKSGRVLDYGCGIKNRARVSQVLKDLEIKGYIVSQKPSSRKGNKAIIYGIRFACGDASVSTTGDASVSTTGDASVSTTGDASVSHKKQYKKQDNKQFATNSKQETANLSANADKHTDLPTEENNKESLLSVPPSSQKTQPEKPAPRITKKGFAVYEEWCKMSWFKDSKPDLTPGLARQCAKLAQSISAGALRRARIWYEEKFPEKRGEAWDITNCMAIYCAFLDDTEYEACEDFNNRSEE